MSLQAVVKSIQDIMRKDAGVDGDAQRLSQLVWMLFLKIFDDQERELELFDPKYRSPIPKGLRWREWAANAEGITGEGMIVFINNKLFPGLKNLSIDPEQNPRGFIVREVFEDSYNYMKDGTLIRQVINKLNEVDFNKKDDRHHFNEVYEHMLKELQSAGNAGEYYTPRALTQFVVEMVAPKLGETVFDPACGTGGFLVNALQYIREHQVKTAADERKLQASIRGIELKPLPHLLAVTNMILHGVAVPKNIRRDDALSRPLRDITQKDRVDVIFANPPFGGAVKDGVEKNFPTEFRTKETADLFLALFIYLLKPDGQAGIVLPDTNLFGENSTKKKIKEKLLTDCNLHTIIRLPPGVFNPYSPVRTNLLFFRKGKPTKEVWFYEMPLPQGLRQYTKGRPIQYEEFEAIKEWWSKRETNKHAWKVSINEIEQHNWNLDFKNPHKRTVAKQRSPQVLLKDIKKRKNATDSYVNKISNLQKLFKKVKDITWEEMSLGELAIEIKSGFACGKTNEVKDGVVHLRTHNIDLSGELNMDKVVKIPQNLVDASSFGLEKGDIIFNNTNSAELVGKSIIIREDLPYAFSNHLTRIRLNTGVAMPEWVLLILQKYWREKVFERMCTRWVGQAGINQTALRKIKIPVPTIAEQKKIILKLDALSQKVGALQALQSRTSTDLRALEQSVLDNVFFGTAENKESHEHTEFVKPNVFQIQQAIGCILQRDFRRGEMAIAKVLYLGQEVYKVPLNIPFTAQNFGPYDSLVKRSLTAGLTRSNKFFKRDRLVFDLGEGAEKLFRYSNARVLRDMNHALDDLMPLIQQADSSAIERLATVCKIMQDNKTTDLNTIKEKMGEWKPGKFTDEQIGKSVKFIIDHGWDSLLLRG